MEHSHLSAVEREQLLDEIATAYLKAVEQGEAPDRRLWLEQHPELAGELEEFFAEQDRLERLARPLRVAVAAVSPRGGDAGVCCPGLLGDYRILREVGRGGMGVVYEAEQLSLGRRAALKVLPFAATMDPRHLQRFHNEARAAASLEHPNIVPVYGVGCDRAVHYYAMKFIEGQSLAAFVQQRRGGADVSEPTTSPAPAPADTRPVAADTTGKVRPGRAYYEQVARLGIEAALALEYAHGLGIVHRDVKPANLILEGQGKLWVADFGLARTGQGELTMTGDMLGTLRYMSPEQALAKHGLVDHRTDVYSLGATLYELLTLRPAVDGKDRQEVLHSIAFDEPVLPRRLEPSVPLDLETVVLKAMAKEARQRYATAKELAEDLRSWLEDRPIRARRPSLGQTALKWARRHRPVVGTAVVGLTLALAVFAGSLGWVAGERRARDRETERVVEAALEQARDNMRRDKLYEALDAAERAEGFLLQGSGHAGLQPRVDGMLWDVRFLLRLEQARFSAAGDKDGLGDWAVGERDFETAFKEFGLDVLKLDTEEVARRLGAREVRVEIAAFMNHWAMMRRTARGDADLGWRKVLEVARRVDPDEARDTWRQGVLRANRAVAWSTFYGGNLRDAWKSPERMKQLREAQRRRPDNFWFNHDLAFALSSHVPPKLDEAVAFYRVCVGLRPRSAFTLVGLAVALVRQGNEEEAFATYKEALRLKPDDGNLHVRFGAALRSKGKVDEAKVVVDEAIACLQEAIRRRPDDSAAHLSLGNALAMKGKVDEAIACHREAIRLQPDLERAHHRLGTWLHEKGKDDEAIVCYREAIRLRPDFAVAHFDLGNALAKNGKVDEAIGCHREAIRLQPDFAEAHINLGSALNGKGKVDEAIACHREAIRLRPDFAKAHNNLGSALLRKGDVQGAVVAYRQAILLKKDDPTAHYNLGIAVMTKGDVEGAVAAYRQAILLKKDYAEAHNNLGNALLRKGDVDEAIAAFRQAILLKKDYAEPHGNLGNALLQKGEVDGAVAEFRQAILLKKDFAMAHLNLGRALLSKGQFRQAVEALRLGHQLGSRRPGWPSHSAVLLRNAERLADMEDRLPALLNGQQRPKDAGERLALAQLCQEHKQLFATAARWYAEAFADQPALADTLPSGNRYNAACASALAGCGQGKDAAELNEDGRARLRKQALGWLRADLQAWTDLLEKQPDKARSVIAQQMGHWQADSDFAGVRGPDALSRLPETERQDWQRLWADVARLAEAAKSARSPPTKPGDTTSPKEGPAPGR